MISLDEHRDYLSGCVNRLDGWLVDYAALLTMYMLDLQEDRGVKGSLLEIGVYKAKYFSVLMRAAKRSGDVLLGIDTFQFVPEREVEDIIQNLVPWQDASYVLLKTASNSLTADELLQEVEAKFRFISIDGSHNCEEVLWDLRLGEDTICREGIIAVDGFMNWTAIGINEGVHRFFATPRRVVPFAMAANKLFLCRPHMANFYRATLEKYAEIDTGSGHSARFLESRASWRGNIEQSIWNYKILLFN